MSLRAWWDEGSSKVVVAVAATALLSGAASGKYLKLPDHLGEPASDAMHTILDEDPGRTQWREVIDRLGGLGATFVTPIAFYGPQPALEPAVYDVGADPELERLSAEIQAQVEEADRRYARWAAEAEWERQRAAAAAQVDRAGLDARPDGYAPHQVRSDGERYAIVEPVYAAPRYVGDRYIYRSAEVDEPAPPPPTSPGW